MAQKPECTVHGYEKRLLKQFLTQSMLENDVASSVFCIGEMNESGNGNAAFKKLFNFVAECISLSNPSLPLYLLYMYKQWKEKISKSESKQTSLSFQNEDANKCLLKSVLLVCSTLKTRLVVDMADNTLRAFEMAIPYYPKDLYQKKILDRTKWANNLQFVNTNGNRTTNSATTINNKNTFLNAPEIVASFYHYLFDCWQDWSLEREEKCLFFAQLLYTIEQHEKRLAQQPCDNEWVSDALDMCSPTARKQMTNTFSRILNMINNSKWKYRPIVYVWKFLVKLAQLDDKKSQPANKNDNQKKTKTNQLILVLLSLLEILIIEEKKGIDDRLQFFFAIILLLRRHFVTFTNLRTVIDDESSPDFVEQLAFWNENCNSNIEDCYSDVSLLFKKRRIDMRAKNRYLDWETFEGRGYDTTQSLLDWGQSKGIPINAWNKQEILKSHGKLSVNFADPPNVVFERINIDDCIKHNESYLQKLLQSYKKEQQQQQQQLCVEHIKLDWNYYNNHVTAVYHYLWIACSSEHLWSPDSCEVEIDNTNDDNDGDDNDDNHVVAIVEKKLHDFNTSLEYYAQNVKCMYLEEEMIYGSMKCKRNAIMHSRYTQWLLLYGRQTDYRGKVDELEFKSNQTHTQIKILDRNFWICKQRQTDKPSAPSQRLDFDKLYNNDPHNSHNSNMVTNIKKRKFDDAISDDTTTYLDLDTPSMQTKERAKPTAKKTTITYCQKVLHIIEAIPLSFLQTEDKSLLITNASIHSAALAKKPTGRKERKKKTFVFKEYIFKGPYSLEKENELQILGKLYFRQKILCDLWKVEIASVFSFAYEEDCKQIYILSKNIACTPYESWTIDSQQCILKTHDDECVEVIDSRRMGILRVSQMYDQQLFDFIVDKVLVFLAACYLLGVGDMNLDNILVNTEGKVLGIDYEESRTRTPETNMIDGKPITLYHLLFSKLPSKLVQNRVDGLLKEHPAIKENLKMFVNTVQNNLQQIPIQEWKKSIDKRVAVLASVL